MLDSYQVDAGEAGLRKLVVSGDTCSLDGLYDDLGLGAAWPDGLRDRLALDGHLYATPGAGR